jgi:hypothetical protein
MKTKTKNKKGKPIDLRTLYSKLIDVEKTFDSLESEVQRGSLSKDITK